MKVYVVVEEYGGIVTSVEVFTNKTDAAERATALGQHPSFNEDEDTITLWETEIVD